MIQIVTNRLLQVRLRFQNICYIAAMLWPFNSILHIDGHVLKQASYFTLTGIKFLCCSLYLLSVNIPTSFVIVCKGAITERRAKSSKWNAGTDAMHAAALILMNSTA